MHYQVKKVDKLNTGTETKITRQNRTGNADRGGKEKWQK